MLVNWVHESLCSGYKTKHMTLLCYIFKYPYIQMKRTFPTLEKCTDNHRMVQ